MTPARTSFIDRISAPWYRFTAQPVAGGMVLFGAAIVALVWANSPWSDSYHHLWETRVAVTLGGQQIAGSLHQLINDGLMVIFFFLVGLEIKREVIAGELSSLRSAALPLVGAVGGMVVPARLYAAFNAGTPAARGWGVPMATDIAFALGVLAFLGKRVPIGLKVFLAALAIADDIGAVLVIALFYSSGVSIGALGVSAALLLVALLANAAGVRRPWAYGLIGIALWGAVSASGIHATVAGVLLAMTIPVRTRVNEESFIAAARDSLGDFEAAARLTADDPAMRALTNTAHHHALERLEELADDALPPLIRMEHALHRLVSFGIMPLFALSNSGVALSFGVATTIVTSPVAWGVMLGLVVGKTVGIFGASWLAVRMGIASLPGNVTWPMIAGAGMLGGIGFTMALFIAALAFPTGAELDIAKLAIFVASSVAGVAGFIYLRRVAMANAPRRTAA